MAGENVLPSTRTSTAAPALGKLIRMRALKPADLPSHSDLQTQQSSGALPELSSFITDVLNEAETFVTTYIPRNFKVKSSSKQSPPSSASVELLSHELNAADLPGSGAAEVWFARTSVHENAAKTGTASWDEFDGGLRADHSKHESEYTPDVIDAHQVLDWASGLATCQRTIGTWNDVDVSVVEMLHHIPPPLNKRLFTVVVLTAKQADKFIVVQVPVDTAGMPGAKYNNATKVTKGMYCSIEYCQLVENGTKVKWQMATASDAKGVLPMWAQKLGVPGAIIADVGLFVGWVARGRAT